MTSKSQLVIAALIGAAVSGVAMHQLHAQAKPPAYVIVQLEVRDRSALDEAGPKMAAATAAHGGKYLARGTNVTPVDGKPAPQSVVLIAFDNVEKAVAYRNSSAVRETAPLREEGANEITFIVEGLPN